MASAGQLKVRLYDKLLAARWSLAQMHGYPGTYEEWLETAGPGNNKECQAMAEAIFDFLTQDVRVTEGIAVSIASSIDVGDKLGAPPWPDETKEAGIGQTDEKGRLE